MDMGKIIVNVDWNGNYAASPANDCIACVATGHSLDELKTNMTEALEFHKEGMENEGYELPAELIPEGMLIDGKYLPWNTKDDVNILIGKQGAMVLFASMMAYNGVMWTSKYLQYKQQIEAATTIDELDLIEIDYSYSDKVIDISSLDIE